MTQYQETPISLNAAAKKYSIPVQTLSRWAAQGRIKILTRPERRGQKMLVDEGSVMIARQAYTPYWRQGDGRQFSMPVETEPPAANAEVVGDNLDSEGQGGEGRRGAGWTRPASAPGAFAPVAVADYPEIETAPLIDKFNHFNRRLADSTKEGYEIRLKNFLDHFPTLPLLPVLIQDYIDDLPGTDAHRHTCATLLRTLYRWAYRLHHIPREIEDPIGLVKFPPDGRKTKLPRVLTDEEATDVINAGRTFEEKTMLRLLWTSGIRAGELRSLTGDLIYPTDKAMPQPSIRPDGKMGERKIWITNQIYDDLKLLAAGKPGYLFTDKNGNQLRKDGLYQRVAWCMKKAGLKGKKLGPYTFRHTFITDVIADSGDMALAQKLAGHSKIATTERYTHLAPAHIAQGFGKFNPEHRENGKVSDEEEQDNGNK